MGADFEIEFGSGERSVEFHAGFLLGIGGGGIVFGAEAAVGLRLGLAMGVDRFTESRIS